MPEPRILMTGLMFGESPRWHDDRLWFCNWGRQEVVAVGPDGTSEVVLRVPTTIPFSIDWLPDGRLLVVSGREGLLLRREPDGSLATHADLSAIDRGFNEIVVDGRGNAYVNGGGFDLMAGEAFAPGIIALVTPDGGARQVADGIAFPNGMAVTADNSTLIIAESYGRRLTAFDIARTVACRTAVPGPTSVMAIRMASASTQRTPSGTRTSPTCAASASVKAVRCCRRSNLDRGCFACMLGGPDGRTLFMMAAEWHGAAKMAEAEPTGQVLTVEAPAPHAGWP